MKSNLEEIPSLVGFVKKLNEQSHKSALSLKLICINPCNPTMLMERGQALYDKEVIDYDEIIGALKQTGGLERIKNDGDLGDNPNCEYFLTDSSVLVGVLAMPSWDYRCAGEKCRKLRITPFGETKACLQDELIPLAKRSLAEQVSTIKQIMKAKEESDRQGLVRHHYSPQIGEVRFGKVAEPVPMSRFKRI